MDYQDLYLEQTDSTNAQARTCALQGVPHGSGVMADSQTAGRGRLSREWFSPGGKNLYCSYILRPAIRSADYAKLTLVAGLAVARYLERLAPIKAGLKWPNDVHIRGRKCGGILCESSLSGDSPAHHYAIIGIGLNLNIDVEDLPEHLQSQATSLLIETGKTFDRKTVFTELRSVLLGCVDDFTRRGFASTLEQWKQYDTTRGQWMVWVTPDRKKVYGKSLGPDKDGLLAVLDGDGIVHRVISGDVTLARQEGR